MPDGKVEFDIVGNSKGIKAAVDDATRHISQETKKWEKDAKDAGNGMESSIGSALKKIAAGFSVAAAGKALLDLGMDAISLASDLEEVQNVVDVTFGSSADQIETWAKNAGAQFGLTETQAKKFTSTLGAMMKSAGLAGPEIVSMSTDLSGLAADMASFYNLDFETAFDKIRSGISGQTEPLKQLGINMSVANLEAFALTKGIKKAFNEMSQGEQIALRYQYIMQATADAQGDFARTSDGYANSLRLMETNVDALKTKLGSALIPIATEATGVINDLLGSMNDIMDKLTKKPDRTVLDDFADIDLDAANKISQIEATAEKARDLVGVMDKIGSSTAGTAIKNLASGANELKENSYQNWENVLGALEGAGAKLPKASSALGVSALAGALSGANLDTDKATAWKTFIGELTANADSLTGLTGKSAEETKQWLTDIAAGVDELDADDPAVWDELFTTFVNGLPGLKDQEGLSVLLSLDTVASGANKLKANSATNWTKVLTALKGAEGLDTVFANDPATSISGLATALSGSPEQSKAEAWKTFIGTLTENVDALAPLTGKSAEETKAWLDDIAAGAAALDENDVTGWSKLFTTFTEGLPGLTDANGAQVFKTLASTSTEFNKLKATSAVTWRGVLSSLKSVNGLENIFGNSGTATKNIEELATALSGNGVDTTTAEAWKTLMTTLSENADAVSNLTGASSEETKKWLENLATAANEIDPGSVDSWDKLLTLFVGGLGGTKEGDEFIDSIVQEMLTMGTDSKVARENLLALGFSTDEIADKQAVWLETCKQLVATIPGLSTIINTETGAVDGGTVAIDEYIDAWEAGNKKLVMMKAVAARQAAIDAKRNAMAELELDVYIAQERKKRLEQQWLSAGGQFVSNNPYAAAYNEAANAVADATRIYEENNAALEQAIEDYEIAAKKVEGMADPLKIAEQGMQNTTEATTELSDELKKSLTSAVDDAKDALTALADYYQQVYTETQKSVEGVMKGFEQVETSEDRIKKKSKELSDQIRDLEDEKAGLDPNKDAEKVKKLEERISDLNYELQTVGQNSQIGAKSTADIVAGLQDQINYAQKYMEYMEQAKRNGFDADMLAELSDGSTDSYEYLKALAEGGNVEQINALYRQAREQRDKMTKQLTDTKLGADEKYDELAAKADTFVKELNKQSEAMGASASTIEGIALGVKSKLPDVADAVDAIIAQLERLDGWEVDTNFGGGFTVSSGNGAVVDGSHATGLNWVPFDGYLAQLHEGEGILTAEENRIWQRFKTGSAGGTDYEALGGVMRDNIKPGGNVYLDGRTVGRVISDMQGKSYRTLERSGWQQ